MKLNDQQKLVDLFKHENENASLRINQLELELVELNKASDSEKSGLKEELKIKDKQYDAFIEELKEKHKHECERLRTSNTGSELMQHELNNLKQDKQDLRKQLEELRYAYDELKDEKEQIFSSLTELRQNKHDSNEIMRFKHQIKLSEKKILDLEEKLVNQQRVSVANNSASQRSASIRSSSSGVCLEPTEIDYLKKIVYSYMMGTDSLTMAKVIMAILKFDEDEKNQLIENEKTKSAAWKFPVLQ